MQTTQDMSVAYYAALEQRKQLSNELFPLMVKDAWYDALLPALNNTAKKCLEVRDTQVMNPSDVLMRILSREEYSGRRYYYISEPALKQARGCRERMLGSKVDEDQLKEIIEEVLHEELSEYNIVLSWTTLHWGVPERKARVLVLSPGE